MIKESIFSFLKIRKMPIIIFTGIVVIFGILFYLYDIPFDAIIYGCELSFVWCAVCLFIDFYKYYKRHKLLHINREQFFDDAEQLPEHMDIIEYDYQELAKELYQAKQELISKNRIARKELLDYYGMWVHQIKTPISSMRLTLQNEDSLLARKLSCDLSHIEQYVEMVLAFLRLDSNSSDYVFKMHELDPLLRQSIRRFSSEFINRKLSLSYTPPSDENGTLQMITDDKWFCFVIEQLLSNALKYTRTGTISIFFSQPKVLCIKDTGIGIAPQDLPRVFEKGYTGCNGRTDKKASGLGLYLCKRICKNLGIGISITSEVDNGTCVYLSLDQYPLKAE